MLLNIPLTFHIQRSAISQAKAGLTTYLRYCVDLLNLDMKNESAEYLMLPAELEAVKDFLEPSEYTHYKTVYANSATVKPEFFFSLKHVRVFDSDQAEFGTGAGDELTLKHYVSPACPGSVNVWVVQHLARNTLGYATFPFRPIDESTFGVVISASAMWRPNERPDATVYTLGKTLTHELGHCLGLLHTFTEPAYNLPVDELSPDQAAQNPGAMRGDGIFDTPPQISATTNYPLSGQIANNIAVLRANTAALNRAKLPIFMSFMDYSYDAAMCLFTKEQMVRMNYFATNNLAGRCGCERAALPPDTPANSLEDEYFVACPRIVTTLLDYVDGRDVVIHDNTLNVPDFVRDTDADYTTVLWVTVGVLVFAAVATVSWLVIRRLMQRGARRNPAIMAGPFTKKALLVLLAVTICIGASWFVWSVTRPLPVMCTLIHEFRRGQDTIKDVACGDTHTLIVHGKSSALSVIGNVSYGQSGCADVTSTSLRTVFPSNVSLVAAGAHHSLVLFNNGKVYAAGSNVQGQLGIDNSRVAQSLVFEEVVFPAVDTTTSFRAIACGRWHSLFLDNMSNLYGCGYNDFGQLGVTGSTTNLYKPELIRRGVAKLSAGGKHSGCVLEGGQGVVVFGSNREGQLGVSPERMRSLVQQPTDTVVARSDVRVQIPNRQDSEMTDVACGGKHTLVIVGTDVYSFGENLHGQLGRMTEELVGRMDLANVGRETPIQCSAGMYHTALVTSEGNVYVCGDNSYGQLGLPRTTTTDHADNVATKLDAYRGQVRSVTCGLHHTIVILRDGTAVAFGENDQNQANIPFA